jgi:competence protein ComEC
MRMLRLPFFWITLCFMIGIILRQWPILLCVLIILVAILFLTRNHSLSLLILFIPLSGLYALSVQTLHHRDAIYHFRDFQGQTIQLQGKIVSDIKRSKLRRTDKLSFILWLIYFQDDDILRPIQGQVLVNLFRKEDLSYGDVIQIEGKLHFPFDFAKETNFSYPDYLRNKGIQLVFTAGQQNKLTILSKQKGGIVHLAFETKKKFSQSLDEALPPHQAALMKALLLGEQVAIPKNIRELFAKTGTAHILAVSGFNVGIVAFIVFLLLKALSFPRKSQYVLTIMAVIFYAILTGGQAPVVRAAVMGVIMLGGFLIERETDSLNLLSLSALILLLINPFNLYDIGFQLSFTSVLFILLLYKRFLGGFKHLFAFLPKKCQDILLPLLALSSAAYLGVCPLVIYYFNIVTPVTLLANVIVVPLTSLNTALGIGLLLGQALHLPVAIFFINCLHVSLNMMVLFTQRLSQIPGGHFSCRISSVWWIALYYVFLCAAVGFISRRFASLTAGPNYICY